MLFLFTLLILCMPLLSALSQHHNHGRDTDFRDLPHKLSNHVSFEEAQKQSPPPPLDYRRAEMTSPLNAEPTLRKRNRDDAASSVMAWLGSAKQIKGKRDIVGYRLHTQDSLGLNVFPDACKNALTAPVQCDNHTRGWTRSEYHGIMPDEIDVGSVCDVSCARSISDWLKAVGKSCVGRKWEDGTSPGILGSFVSYGINETCQKDKKSGQYCNDVIFQFSDAETIKDMPTKELCSDCYVNRLKMMQASPYSIYWKESYYQEALKAAVSRCSLGAQPTATKEPPFPKVTRDAGICLSNVRHTTVSGDTCDSLALRYQVSSAAIFSGNPDILDCNDVIPGVSVCMPLQCKIYKLQATDSCRDVEAATGVSQEAIRDLNPWIEVGCGNLQSASQTLGSVMCLSSPGGEYKQEGIKDDADPTYPEFAPEAVKPPAGAILADDTTTKCGTWHKASDKDDCARVLARYHVSLDTFVLANPSVSPDNCTEDLGTGLTYCANPTRDFLDADVKIPGHWRFGCYARDSTTSGEAILRLDGARSQDSMTLVGCKVYCRSQSLNVFGLEGGDKCLCDTRLRMDSRLMDDADCRTACNGNSSESCGGDGAVEVYSLGPSLLVESVSLGCFKEEDASRRVILGGKRVDEEDMSPHRCGSLCTTSSNAFFSLGNGTVCTCGQELASSATSTDMEECNVGCGSGLGYLCGGKGLVEVFRTTSDSGSDGTKSAPRKTPPLPRYEHIGCYSTAKPGVRGLSHSLTEAKLGMTVEYCAEYCLLAQGQPLFGLERTTCRCGSRLDMGTEGRPAADCAAPCAGNGTQSCGGKDLLNVFGATGARERPLSYSHMGCYSRGRGRTAWGGAQDSVADPDLTIEQCARKCTRTVDGSEVIMFSVDGGDRCSCASSVTDQDLLGATTTKADCNIPCAGDPDAWCGGENAGNVYRAWP